MGRWGVSILSSLQTMLAEEVLRSTRVVNAEAERKARAEADAAEADRDTKRHILTLVLDAKAAQELPAPKGGWSA
jgi:hypothetical protein